MHFHIKHKRQFSRERVQLATLNSLLISRKIIQLPQQSLNRKILIDASPKQHSSDKQKFVSYQHRSRSYVQFKNNSIATSMKAYRENQQMKKNMLNSLRRTWNPEQVKQAEKRLTLGHFRHRSLQLGRQKYHSKAQSLKIMRTPSQFVARYYQPIQLNSSKKQLMINQVTHGQKYTQPQSQNIVRKRSQYLKKGSDVNKRVVTNLLKLKLGKKRFEDGSEENNTIRNNEILKMIKICKGYGQIAESQILKENQKDKFQHLFKEQKDGNAKQQFNLKMFPFKNINIQLSVSQWQNKIPCYQQEIDQSHEQLIKAYI